MATLRETARQLPQTDKTVWVSSSTGGWHNTPVKLNSMKAKDWRWDRSVKSVDWFETIIVIDIDIR